MPTVHFSHKGTTVEGTLTELQAILKFVAAEGIGGLLNGEIQPPQPLKQQRSEAQGECDRTLCQHLHGNQQQGALCPIATSSSRAGLDRDTAGESGAGKKGAKCSPGAGEATPCCRTERDPEGYRPPESLDSPSSAGQTPRTDRGEGLSQGCREGEGQRGTFKGYPRTERARKEAGAKRRNARKKRRTFLRAQSRGRNPDRGEARTLAKGSKETTKERSKCPCPARKKRFGTLQW